MIKNSKSQAHEAQTQSGKQPTLQRRPTFADSKLQPGRAETRHTYCKTFLSFSFGMKGTTDASSFSPLK